MYLGLTVMILCVITACSDDAKNNIENTEFNEENDTTENQENETNELQYGYETMQEEMDELNFLGFKMVANFPENKKYYAEIKQNSKDIVEAYMDNEIHGLKFEGYAAFNDIRATINGMELSKDSSQEEVIDQVTSGFTMPDDYTDIKVDIIFKDGTKKNYSIEK